MIGKDRFVIMDLVLFSEFRPSDRLGRGPIGRGPVRLETAGGPQQAVVRAGQVSLHMPDPVGLQIGLRLAVGSRRLQAAFIDTGVPQLVVPVRGLARLDVERMGRALRGHRRFAPRGTNVTFLEATGARTHTIHVRTYERGVEAETPACGTGVVAAAIIHGLREALSTAAHRIQVQTKSRERMVVTFRVRQAAGRIAVRDVVLHGPARKIYDGSVAWPLEGCQ